MLLKANEERELVVSFVPSAVTGINRTVQSDQHYSYIPLHGTIHFLSEAMTTSSHNTQQQHEGGNLMEHSVLPPLSVSVTQQVKFSANVCYSYLETDVSQLQFGHCLVNEKQIKEFTVWNRSEIPLSFNLMMKEGSFGIVEFTEYETGKSISQNILVSAYAHMRISITFTPLMVGDWEIPIYVENKNNGTNICAVSLLCSIANQEVHESGLKLLDEDGAVVTSIDFGYCYSESTKRRNMTIRNESYEVLDLFFSSDSSDSTITFELASEESLEKYSEKKMLQERIEEISIRPGEEKQVIVCYTPQQIDAEDFALTTKLMNRKFKLYISAKDSKKVESDFFTVTCNAMVCSSIVEVRQKKINLGDSSIGSLRCASIEVVNRSEIPAHIAVEFVSKIITCSIKKATIRPKQSITLTFKLSPRRVNTNYKKQITIVNLDNRNNDNIVEIQSNNIDKNMLMFHALFYDVRAPSQHNFAKTINFDSLVINKPILRKFQISNTSRSSISLQLSNSSPDEIKLYTVSWPISSPKREGKSIFDEKQTASPMPSSDHSPAFDFYYFLQSISKCEESSLESRMTKESEYVKAEMDARENLEKLISKQYLVECSVLDLEPKTDMDVYVLFRPSGVLRPDVSSTLKKIEESIYINLLSYEQQSNQPDKQQIPPRELTILAKVCRSMMDLTQKHINFGTILDSEERTKTLGISNLSEVPLLYRVKKTGSIASGDLQVSSDSKVGVLRGYGSRELKFKFKPSLSGKFHETLTFVNVQDPEALTVITIKADIKKHQRFAIKNNDIDFSDVIMNTESALKRIVITNTTKQRRVFDIKVDHNTFENWFLKFAYDLDPVSVNQETEKLESELEDIDKKMKIAVRKGKSSKVEKLDQRVKEIKKQLNFDKEDDDTFMSSSEDESEQRKRKRFKTTESGIRFAIPAKGTQVVNVSVTPYPNDEANIVAERGNGKILISETKNVDSQQIVTFNLNVLTSRKRAHSDHKRKIQPPILAVEKPLVPQDKDTISFIVSPLNIDLKEVDVEAKVNCKFTIFNKSLEPAGFVVMNKSASTEAKISFSQNNGEVPANGECVVEVHFETFSMGSQRHYISVQNLRTKKIHTVLIACTPQSASPVSISMLNEQQEFDFGFTYLPQGGKKIAKVFPFTLSNNKDQNLNFDIVSNSPSQVYAYLDEELTRKAVKCSLLKGESQVVYVCISPSLSAHDKQKGHCRLLVGGLRCQIFNEDRSKKLYERTVRYRTIVGRMILNCSTLEVDFGCISSLDKPLESSFVMENGTMHMPLNYEIQHDSDSLELDISKGRLDAISVDKKREGSSKVSINFAMKIHSYGVHMDTIRIVNSDDHEVLHEIKVRVFVDDKQSLETSLGQTSSGVDVVQLDSIYATTSQSSSEKISLVSMPNRSDKLNEMRQAVGDEIFIKSGLQQKSKIIAVQSFTLKNKTSRDMILVAESDFHITLVCQQSYADERHDNLTKDNLAMFVKDRKKYTSLPFKLPPAVETTVYLVTEDLPSVTIKQREALKKNQTVSMTGTLLLTDISSNRHSSIAVKLIYINASICISEGVLPTTSINLGKIGFINNWMNDFFTFHLQNLSDSPLVVKPIASADDIQILGVREDGTITVEPLDTTTVKSVLVAKKFMSHAGSNVRRHIDILNINNPSNHLKLDITSTLTRRAWKFSRIEQDHIITLPILQHPAINSSVYSDRAFGMTNQSEDTIECKFEFVSETIIRSFLKVEILNNVTSAPLRDYQFRLNDSLAVRVRCSAVSADALIPQALLKYVQTDSQPATTFKLGELKIRARDQKTEVFAIWGSLSQMRTFTTTSTNLVFRPANALTVQSKHGDRRKNPMNVDKTKRVLSQTFTLTNIKPFAPLHFRFDYSPPKDNNLQINVVPVQGSLEPGVSAVLSVFLESKDGAPLNELPEGTCVEVNDIYAPLSSAVLPLRILNSLGLNELSSSESTVNDYSAIPSPIASMASKFTPTLSVKGCTPIKGADTNRFEINVGQVNQNELVTWELTLQNNSPLPVEYCVYEVGRQNDTPSWLHLSNSEGTLSNHLDSQSITVTFMTETIKTHSTYLIIENKNNPEDMKTIRVNMEVVLSGRSAAKKLFNVLVDGSPIDQNNILDLGEVFVGHMVKHRSIDIVNVSDVELEFHLTSNVQPDSSAELHFSLSLTSLKSFHTLRVDPYGKTKVYILYKPNYNTKDSTYSGAITSDTPCFIDEQQLFIKCRLVKDYQEVVTLRAKCSPPQINIPSTDLLFVAKDTSSDIEPESEQIVIENCFDEPLLYTIRSDFCIYFNVEIPNKCLIGENEKHYITIRPNIAKIFSSDDVFQQGKYIEEHLTIYNRKNMKEKWWVSIRFARGYLRQFFTAPGPRNAFAFSSLEERISLLLRQFKMLCDTNLEQVQDQMRSSSRNGPARSLERVGLVSKMFKKKQFNLLYFDLRYLTDELVFYGLKGKAGQAFFDLAKLLYSVLFSHRIFTLSALNEEEEEQNVHTEPNPSILSGSPFDDLSPTTRNTRIPSILQKWRGQLTYFLSYFPDRKEELKVLLVVNESLFM